jgi:ketosteroid isomerase-like protein
MKALKLLKTAPLAGLAVLASTLGAAENEADRAALAKVRTLYEEVVQSDDLTKLAPYLHPELTAVTPTGMQVKGPQELQAYFKKIWGLIGKEGRYQVKVNVGETAIFGNIAVSYGTTDEFVRTAGGREYQFPLLWTAVSHKEKGQWKVIRMHGSIDPLHNAFVNDQLKMSKITYGLGGLVLGLVAGFLLRWRRRA